MLWNVRMLWIHTFAVQCNSLISRLPIWNLLTISVGVSISAPLLSFNFAPQNVFCPSITTRRENFLKTMSLSYPFLLREVGCDDKTTFFNIKHDIIIYQLKLLFWCFVRAFINGCDKDLYTLIFVVRKCFINKYLTILPECVSRSCLHFVSQYFIKIIQSSPNLFNSFLCYILPYNWSTGENGRVSKVFNNVKILCNFNLLRNHKCNVRLHLLQHN